METDKHLLELAAKAAGGLDWEWWTSNSYRRLTFKGGQDGGALHGTVHPYDKWPDVSMAPGVQEFIERASPKAVLALLDRISELEAALRPFAAEAATWADTVPDAHRSLCNEPGYKQAFPGSETTFTVGDLRRAAAALGGEHA